MLVVKTIDQVITTYHVPDVLTGDFFRWLAIGTKTCKDFMVAKDPLSETVIHAYRTEDPRPGDGEGQGVETGASETSDEGVRTK